jgi:hypothetical protein
MNNLTVNSRSPSPTLTCVATPNSTCIIHPDDYSNWFSEVNTKIKVIAGNVSNRLRRSDHSKGIRISLNPNDSGGLPITKKTAVFKVVYYTYPDSDDDS